MVDIIKNVLHPDKVKKLAKKVYDDYIKSPVYKSYMSLKDEVKKIKNLQTPFAYQVATPYGDMKIQKTVSEVVQDTKESIVQMAKKLDEVIVGKGTGENNKVSSEVKRTFTGDMMDPFEAVRYDEYWRNIGIASNATYDEFIKRNPKRNLDDYLKLVKEESPWPDRYSPKPVTLKSGYTFEMALAKGQGPQ